MNKSNTNSDDGDFLSPLPDIDFDDDIQSFINMSEDIVRMKSTEDASIFRKKKRALVKILASLVHQIQQDNAVFVAGEDSTAEGPKVSHRPSNSELKVLENATSTLEALITINKNLKKKHSFLKKK